MSHNSCGTSDDALGRQDGYFPALTVSRDYYVMTINKDHQNQCDLRRMAQDKNKSRMCLVHLSITLEFFPIYFDARLKKEAVCMHVSTFLLLLVLASHFNEHHQTSDLMVVYM